MSSLKVVERYGGPQEIRRKAAEAGKPDHLLTPAAGKISLYPGSQLAHRAARQEGFYFHAGLFPESARSFGRSEPRKTAVTL